MAQLRGMGPFQNQNDPNAQQPDEDQSQPQMPLPTLLPPMQGATGAPTSAPESGAGGATGQTPRQRQPGNGPIATPTQPQAPSPAMGGGAQSFAGGGNQTIMREPVTPPPSDPYPGTPESPFTLTPPSVTKPVSDFTQLNPPSPFTLVFGENPASGGMLGKSGGLQGGGLGTPGAFDTVGNDPNSLITMLLKLAGK